MPHLEYKVGDQLQSFLLDTNTVTYLAGDREQVRSSKEATSDALAAFYRSKRYFVLLGLGPQAVFVNQCRITLFKIVREADSLVIGPYSAVFRELTSEILRPDSALVASGKRCFVDGAAFKPNDKVVYCPSCKTPHHERCWRVMKGRCANGKGGCQYQGPWDEAEGDPR